MLRKSSSIQTPAVVGAVIDLGFCLDLTDARCLKELRQAYWTLASSAKEVGVPLPHNSNVGSSRDLFMRRLDCAVINALHMYRQDRGLRQYDSVKGAFFEGDDLYPGAGFKSRSHIQICVRNPNCVKGFFVPRSYENDYKL